MVIEQQASSALFIEEVSFVTSRSNFLVVIRRGMKKSVVDSMCENIDQSALSHGRVEGTCCKPRPTLKEIVLWSELL